MINLDSKQKNHVFVSFSSLVIIQPDKGNEYFTWTPATVQEAIDQLRLIRKDDIQGDSATLIYCPEEPSSELIGLCRAQEPVIYISFQPLSLPQNKLYGKWRTYVQEWLEELAECVADERPVATVSA